MAALTSLIKHFGAGVWLFPACLAILLVILTGLQISGSSVGIYHSALYGEKNNTDLIVNKPLSVRSDEWLVSTQLTIAQDAAGYPLVNPNINGGSNMSLVGDAPYKDWSAVFRPQNLIFFILPLEYALAFKWWLLLFLVIVSSYFFVLRIFSGRRLMAALIGSVVGCSPFLFWWYQTGTLAPIFYGFFIILMGMRIINNEKISWLRHYPERYSQAISMLALSYLLIAFGLILYPPFQIPIAICVAAFLAGYLLERFGRSKKTLFSRAALSKIVILTVSIFIAGGTMIAFLQTRDQAVGAIQQSAYPGSREISGGGTPVFQIFSTFLQPQLGRDDRAFRFYDNPSEASNFILLFPFLLLPGFIALYLEYRQKHTVGWSLLAVQLVGLLFLLNLFVGYLQPLYKLLLLDQVAHPRLFIGLGFVGALQLVLFMKSMTKLKLTKRNLIISAALYCAACLAVLLWSAGYVREHWPLFISSSLLIGAYAVIFTCIIFLFISRRFLPGSALLFSFSLLSVLWIHPLYRGMEPVYPSKLSHAIQANSKPGDTWVTLDDISFENAAAMAGRSSLSGIQLYPNLTLWRQVEGPKSDFIYNRYAHILFASDQSSPQKLRLASPDNFHVKFTCSDFIKKHVQYVLVKHPFKTDCVHLIDTVKYPSATFYIYRVD